MPGFVDQKFKSFRNRLIQKNAKPFMYDPLPEELFKELYKEFLPDIAFIEKMIGKEITSWH